MTYEAFRDACFAQAQKLGCKAETYFVDASQTSIEALDGKLDSYSASGSLGLCLRVTMDGKTGYAYTEALDEPEALVAHAFDNARAIESGDEPPMQGAQVYPAVAPAPDPLGAMSEEQKIDLALALEREAKGLDARCTHIGDDAVETARQTVRIDNTEGLSAREERAVSLIYVSPILEENGEVHDGGAFRMGAEAADIKACAAEAVREAAAQFGAKPAPAGEYRILLRNDAAGSFLSAFVPMFSADMAQKGLSLLAGKEGETVAAACVHITDDPLHPLHPRAFDAEGTPSAATRVVEGGVLKTLLHNCKTARKAGVCSTSNAGKAGVASPVSVAPSNFYIEPGEKDYDGLVRALGDGLVITEVSGLHAGVNTVSGAFSLLAKGLLVQGGKAVRPVEQITVAGTFLDIMRDVLEVGRDLRFGLPSGGMIGSPSLLIAKAMVAGE